MKELINNIEDKSQIVRRYMDYPKFLSLLVTESIYFAKPIEFKDPLDALCPKYTNMENSKYIRECNKAASSNLAQKTLAKLEESIEMFRLIKEVTQDDIKKIFDQVIIGSALDGLNDVKTIYYKHIKDRLDEIACINI